MLKLVHSNRVDVLLARLIADHEAQLATGKLGVFDAYQVVVPSSGFRIWLTRAFARELSVCAQINMQLWGTYRWGLERRVLEATPRDQLPKRLSTRLSLRSISSLSGVLSSSTMRFRLLGFFLSKTTESTELWRALASSELSFDAARFVSSELARVFSDYLTHRPEWVRGWSESDLPLDTDQMLNRLTQLRARFGEEGEVSESELERVKQLEAVQRRIWRLMFSDHHLDLLSVEALFWQRLENGASDLLPRQIAIMTEERLPLSGLEFLLRLSRYVDVLFLNQTPSREFFGDIADPLWLKEQALLSPDDFDQQYRETGHPLLARLGKQARDRFRLLAGLSGNSLGDGEIDNEDWFVAAEAQRVDSFKAEQNDLFDEPSISEGVSNLSALELIQSGICTLNPSMRPVSRPELQADQGASDWADPSLRLNACADLVREVEVLREDLALWLSEDPARQPSDIAVLVPNLEEHAAIIEALLPASYEDGIRLPVRLTGLSDKKLIRVWQAYLGRFNLLQGQLSLPTLAEWLNLPEVQAQWGLSVDMTERATELLSQAGFRRSLNRETLSADLTHFDGDSRHTLEGALMRLCLGLLGPSDTYVAEQHLSMPVPLSDGPLVQILVQIYASLEQSAQLFEQSRPLTGWRGQLHESNAHLERQTLDPAVNPVDDETIAEPLGGWLDAVLIPDLKRLASELQDSELTRIAQIAVELSKTCGSGDTELGAGKVKLSQALSLLDEAIGTQTLGAEPAHAITVCPLGTLRNMPFKLIVMLHLSAKSLSAAHTVSNLNLMKYEPQKLGDLQREEDQSASFLEALLAAKEAFWVYCPSQSEAAEPELPAHPVVDLGVFLVGGAGDPQALTEQLRAAGWLALHGKNPMNSENYSGLGARRAGFWWRLSQGGSGGEQALKRFADGSLSELKRVHDQSERYSVIQDQPDGVGQHELALPEVLELDDLVYGLKKPDRVFYRAAKLMELNQHDPLAELEALDMNQLTLFGARQLLKSQIIKERSELPTDHEATDLSLNSKLNPKLNEVRAAGHSGSAALEQLYRVAQHQLNHAASKLGDQVSFDPPLKSTLLVIGATELWANLPHQHCHWLMQIAGKYDSLKWRLDAYLTHLAWQVQLAHIKAGLSAPSYALFSCGKLVRLPPIDPAQASDRLHQWIALYALMQDRPLSLPVTHSLKAADKWQQEPPSTQGIDAHWRKDTGYSFDESSEDSTWSVITRGRAASSALLEDLIPYQALYAQVSAAFEEIDLEEELV